jgi:hypothetical protein
VCVFVVAENCDHFYVSEKLNMMTAFWDIEPFNRIEVDQLFRGAYCLHHQGNDHPDDGGSTHL